jgi:hypothetical protein
MASSASYDVGMLARRRTTSGVVARRPSDYLRRRTIAVFRSKDDRTGWRADVSSADVVVPDDVIRATS